MTWVEGDYWLLTLDLPAGEHEFKVAAATNGGGCHADWESGGNRVVQASLVGSTYMIGLRPNVLNMLLPCMYESCECINVT